MEPRLYRSRQQAGESYTLTQTLESVEAAEWKSGGGGKRERTGYARYAEATFRKVTSLVLVAPWSASA
jgi:hypothetical protein